MNLSLSSRVCLISCVTAALALTISQVLAHGNATGIVKERMDYMESLSDHTKPLGAMFKGETPYDLAAVQEHATFLADKAPQLVELFPEGTNEMPSESLPVIWEQWEDFQAVAATFEETSAALLEAANSGAEQAQVRAAFARMGKTCGNCHEVYRKEKD